MVNTTGRGMRTPLVVAVATALLAVAGCGGSKAGQPETEGGEREDASFVEPSGLKPETGGSIAYGLSGESDGWNPTLNRWGAPGQQVAKQIYDHLAELDIDGRPQPFLAESIEPDETYTHWTITVRDGVTFHDGTPLEAAAVVANIEAHRQSILSGPAFAPVDSVEVTDRLTVSVTMSSSWSAFPVVLTSQAGVVAEPSTIGYGADGTLGSGEITAAQNPVGSGPFVFDSWEPDRELVVTRNDSYWQKGLPYLDEVRFQPVVDPTNRTSSLFSGDLDVISVTTAAGQIKRLREAACAQEPCEEGSIRIYDTTGKAESEEGMMMVNVLNPPFDDPVARQAVAHAINRDDLLESIFLGEYEIANAAYPPSSPWYADLSDVVPQWDPELARQLAEEYEATHGEPIRFEFSVPATLAEVTDAAHLVVEQLREVGIEAEVESYEMTKYTEKIVTGDFQGIAFLWFSAPDPDGEYVWLHSSSMATNEDGAYLATGGISLNFARLADPEIDAALEAGRATDDLEVRKQQSDIVQRRLAEELPYMTLFHSYALVAWRPTVHDVVRWTLPGGEEGLPADATGVHPLLTTWVEHN